MEQSTYFFKELVYALSHTSFIYLYGPDQVSSDLLKPDDVGFQHFHSIEPHGSSGTDADGKTKRDSLEIIETQATEEQNTQTRSDQEKDSVRPPLQTDETQPESHKKRETQTHLDTSDDYALLPSKPRCSSDSQNL